MANLVGALASAVGRVTGAALRVLSSEVPRGRGTATIAVAADQDAALLVSAAALRRLGTRIIRYETEDAVVQARDAATGALVEVRAHGPDPIAATGQGDVTLLQVTGDGAEARRLVRRFRRELSRRAAPEDR